ncbi:unnamed protein product [Ambrosiozyma monospora]|uniref:Unnamed protein product n=1 Tax=Ambrosiozyma monospora TaxID=43982 RepID=A0ACB5TCD8_AMBMO|nr:unnamed protein product [Ambrosiozyma monospora]
MVTDILPSYQLHEYISRDIDTIISDLKNSQISNPNYLSPDSFKRSVNAFNSSNDHLSIQSPPYSESSGNSEWYYSESLSDGVRSIPGHASDYLVNQFHAETNFKKSLLAHFYELRYRMQDAIAISVSINGLSNINDKTYTSGDLVEGSFKLYNKSSLDIDLGIVLVTLEGNYWWKTKKKGRSELITKPFMTLVEIEASVASKFGKPSLP